MATSDAAPGLRSALARVGDRWTLLIVYALMGGPRRFNELQADLHGIASTVLTQRLRQLEHDQLIVLEAYSARPVRSSYRLTSRGEALAGPLRLLAHWGTELAATPEAVLEPVTHDACDTTSDRVVGDDELDELRWV